METHIKTMHENSNDIKTLQTYPSQNKINILNSVIVKS